jgi:hypothetical protein
VKYDILKDITFTVKWSEEDETWLAENNKYESMKSHHDKRPQIALEYLCETLLNALGWE